MAGAKEDRGNPLLFFLHGLGASSRTFRPLIEELRNLQDRFDFVAPDFWGFGGTAKPERLERVSLRAFAEQVLELISKKALNHGRSIHLIGHSMGGAVAVELHRIAPALKVESFLNLEGNLQLEDCTSSKKVSEQNRKAFCSSGFEDLKEGVRSLAHRGYPAARDWLDGLERTTADVFYDASTDLVHVSHSLYTAYRDWGTRTLYVFGEETLKTSKATHDRLRMDRKSVVIIPRAGHVMLVERPDATAAICRAHLEG